MCASTRRYPLAWSMLNEDQATVRDTMTLESFANRLALALTFSGAGVWVAAFVCWSSVGDGGPVVHSIHTVAGSVLAVFGTALIGIGLTILLGIPPRSRSEDPSVQARDSSVEVKDTSSGL